MKSGRGILRRGRRTVLKSLFDSNLFRAGTDNDGIRGWTGQEAKPLGKWLAAGLDRLKLVKTAISTSEGRGGSVSVTIRRKLAGTDKKALVTFVQTTRHERVAMHIAYLMKQNAIEELKAMGYRPAQDYLAELFLPEYKKAIFTPKNETVIPPAEYVSYIFRALSKVEEHQKEGTSRKLSKDEIIMHDELWGAFMDCFTTKEVKVAKEMYAMLWKTSHLDMAQEMAFNAMGYYKNNINARLLLRLIETKSARYIPPKVFKSNLTEKEVSPL